VGLIPIVGRSHPTGLGYQAPLDCHAGGAIAFAGGGSAGEIRAKSSGALPAKATILEIGSKSEKPRRSADGARWTLACFQAVIAVWVQTAVVEALARAAKSSASLVCQARAVSVTARCAAIRSSTARRR
jgi:hypothetical protein